MVCCDNCGLDAFEEEYFNLKDAQNARDAVLRQGWALRVVDYPLERLMCPDCSADNKPKRHLSVVDTTVG